MFIIGKSDSKIPNYVSPKLPKVKFKFGKQEFPFPLYPMSPCEYSLSITPWLDN